MRSRGRGRVIAVQRAGEQADHHMCLGVRVGSLREATGAPRRRPDRVRFSARCGVYVTQISLGIQLVFGYPKRRAQLRVDLDVVHSPAIDTVWPAVLLAIHRTLGDTH